MQKERSVALLKDVYLIALRIMNYQHDDDDDDDGGGGVDDDDEHIENNFCSKYLPLVRTC